MVLVLILGMLYGVCHCARSRRVYANSSAKTANGGKTNNSKLNATTNVGVKDAADAGVENFIAETVKKLGMVNNYKDTQRREVEAFKLAMEILDFSWMGNYILGKHRRVLTREQIDAFIEEYSKFLLGNYLPILSSYGDCDYEIVNIDRVGDSAGGNNTNDGSKKNTAKNATKDGGVEIFMAATVLKYQGKNVHNTFRVMKKGINYHIVDIITEGISFVSAQRNEVNSLIGSRGFDKFMEELKTKNTTR